MTAVLSSRLFVLPSKHHDSSCYEMELEGRLSSVKRRKAFKSGQRVFEVNMFNKLGATNPGTAVK